MRNPADLLCSSLQQVSSYSAQITSGDENVNKEVNQIF